MLLIWSASQRGTCQAEFVVDSSRISFEIKNAGFPVQGHFSGLQATIEFDNDDLSGCFISATIPAASIQTGIKLRDRHLKKYDFFDVEQFPNIKMVSKAFNRVGDASFLGKFELFLKGVSQEIEMPFTFSREEEGIVLEGSFEIDRQDFGIGGSSLTLGDEVKVHLFVWGR